jgi:hypothetical protein
LVIAAVFYLHMPIYEKRRVASVTTL